jgi:hypothetical protein
MLYEVPVWDGILINLAGATNAHVVPATRLTVGVCVQRPGILAVYDNYLLYGVPYLVPGRQVWYSEVEWEAPSAMCFVVKIKGQ